MVSAKFALLAGLAAAATVSAAPLSARQNDESVSGQANIDTVILNYALTLEHLEAVFYHDSLKKLSAEDFANAGFQPAIRERFLEIGGDEISHVKFLESALGDQAVARCQYNFGVTDVASFIATAQLLEGVGVSAYLGAAANITSRAYLTAAGSILTTEARHSAWVQSSAAKSDPAGAPYDVPLNFNQTYSLAAPLITSCPSSNAALPVVAFPGLTLGQAVVKPGDRISVSGKGVKDGQYLASISASGTQFSQISNGKATVSKKLSTGRAYFLVTSSDSAVTDDNTIAGPAVSDYLLSAKKAASLVASQYD